MSLFIKSSDIRRSQLCFPRMHIYVVKNKEVHGKGYSNQVFAERRKGSDWGGTYGGLLWCWQYSDFTLVVTIDIHFKIVYENELICYIFYHEIHPFYILQ